MADTADDQSKAAPREKTNVSDPRQIELFKEFLKVQAEEIEVKRQTYQIERENNKANHEIAKLSLEAHRKDREDQRIHDAAQGKRTYFFILAVLFLVLLFAGYALYVDKETIVKEIGQTIIVVLGAASAGYTLCLKKHVVTKDDGDDE